MPRTAPYGSWASPLSAERAVAAGIGLGDPAFDGDAVLWQESRPAEKGRSVGVSDPEALKQLVARAYAG